MMGIPSLLRLLQQKSAVISPKQTLKIPLSGAANDCDFNRSMQHLISTYREEDVENETETEDLLH